MTVTDNCGRVHDRLDRLGNSRKKEAEKVGSARGGWRDRVEVAEEKEELEVRHDV